MMTSTVIDAAMWGLALLILTSLLWDYIRYWFNR